MADDDAEVLRRSLASVDRHRNRLLIGIALAMVLLLALRYGAEAVAAGNTNVLVHHIMLILGLWTTMLALAVVVQITVMTKRILRAIEPVSKK